MKDFKEYISESDEKQLDEDLLLEDPATIVAAILAIPTLVAVGAWGASVVAAGYYRFLSGMTDRTVEIWRKLARDTKGRVTRDRVIKNVKEMARDPKAREQTRQMKEGKREYEEELKYVYANIDKQDWEAAKKSFNSLEKNIKNNPDIHKIIIHDITHELKEPPLYTTSPGNKTYQAIKKVLNIRVARAAAMATKMAIEKSLRDDEVREMEQEGE